MRSQPDFHNWPACIAHAFNEMCQPYRLTSRLDSSLDQVIPVLTGQNLRALVGGMQPESLLWNLCAFSSMDSDRIGRLAFSGSDNLHHLIECNYTEACTLSRFLALDAIRSDKSEDWYYYPCFAPLNPIGWDDISEDSAANKAETVKYFLANAGLAWDTSIPAGFALYDMTYRPVQGSSFLYCYNYFDHTYEHDPGPNLAYVDAASFLLACLCAESEHIPLGYIITDRQDIPTYERGLLSTLMLGHLNGLSKLSRVAAARETMLVMMQILRGAIDSFPDGVIHTWPHFCGTWPDVCLLEDPEVRYPFYASRAIITPLD